MASWLLAIRPRTLPAAAVPVALGTALAQRLAEWAPPAAFLCLAFALLVQAGTNLANDYFDFVKGADTPDRVGPRRMVASGLISPAAMLRATVLTFTLAFLVGLNLVYFGGWWLVGIGAASILFGFAYTAGPFPLAYKGLGDLFVFTFFGLIAVSFTFYVQTGFFAAEGWLVGAATGALAVNILVVNNYRDCETDARAEKRTLVVRFGRRFARVEYGAMAGAGLLAPVGLFLRGWGWPVLFPLLLLPVSLCLMRRLRASSAAGANRLLAQTAGLLLAFGVLLCVGILLG